MEYWKTIWKSWVQAQHMKCELQFWLLWLDHFKYLFLQWLDFEKQNSSSYTLNNREQDPPDPDSWQRLHGGCGPSTGFFLHLTRMGLVRTSWLSCKLILITSEGIIRHGSTWWLKWPKRWLPWSGCIPHCRPDPALGLKVRFKLVTGASMSAHVYSPASCHVGLPTANKHPAVWE